MRGPGGLPRPGPAAAVLCLAALLFGAVPLRAGGALAAGGGSLQPGEVALQGGEAALQVGPEAGACPACPAPALAEPGAPFRAPPPERLSERRRRLAAAVGEGVVALRAAATKSIEGDYPQDSDFRQGNDFFYLTGLETPDAWLVIVAGGSEPEREVLFVPPRNPGEERWTGPTPGVEGASRASGIEDVRTTEALAGFLADVGAAALDAPDAVLWAPREVRVREDSVYRSLVAVTGAEIRDVEPALARLRLVKDPFEIDVLRRAVEITAAAQRAAMRAAEPGMYEYELEAVIEYNFRRGGAERVGFPSIVGSGPNSVVLHYDDSRRRTEPGDLVVMDVGAEYSYYSADVTRTIPVSGRFTERQRRIYDLVLGAQEAALSALGPGVTWRELSAVARTWLRERSGDACGEPTCEAYFVHGLGHWLGMDVHDVGSYGAPLEPGMVLTIEPGIYLPEEDLGVRIEDDVLVTEDGYELLSAGAPRRAEEIEALMTEGGGGSGGPPRAEEIEALLAEGGGGR